jgi:S1-C subfamily serine protease
MDSSMRGGTMKLKITAIVLAAAVAGGLVGAGVGLALDGGSSDTGSAVAAVVPATTASGKALTPEQIYRSAAPAVVVITSTETKVVAATPFSPATKERLTALGSGFVIDKNGDIVTNAHVVQGGTGMRVGFSSGASYPAKVVATDPSTDVAVVRVNAPASALHPLAFADSTTVAVGDPVYAIGNPFGLDRTMTAGIVSATGRDIQAPNGITIPNAIQTDAPINHGNSGGPLLDRLGRVIGINSQLEGGTVDANVGVGFAVPSDTAKSVAAELIADGHAQHAWLGVQIEAIDPSVAKSIRGLPPSGLAITRVFKNSPAADVGLKAATREATVDGVGVPLGGDVIVAVDGKGVTSAEELGAIVAEQKPDDSMTLVVVRGGVRREVPVTLGNVPARSN